MSAFKSAVITKKGQALLAKVIAGTTELKFTKIATSENTLSGDLASLTGIGTVKQSVQVANVMRQNSSNVKVSASFSNSSLNAGYYIRNIGLYATDPTDGEILYSISVADESTATADWMPPFNGIGVSSLLVDLVTAVSNASSVNVTVDPTATATVSQIINLQEQIDDVRTFVGYEEDDVYGVEVDFVNKKFTRIAGAEYLTAGAHFDNLTPWMRKRCNVADDGTVLAYRGDTGYIETGKTTQEITVNDVSYPSGTAVQVMVEQPLFYTKVVPVKAKNAISGRGKQLSIARYYISPTPKVGFKVNDAFKDANGVIQDKIYLSAYEGCFWDTSESKYITDDAQVVDFATDFLSSIANAKPTGGYTQQMTRGNARKLATNRGAGWSLHNIFALAVTQILCLVEYASFDVQSKIGRGVCDFADDGSTNMALVTGATAGIGNGSGIPDGGTNGKCSVTYRGEENLWGNMWTWLDGVNHYAKDASTDTVFVKGYGTMEDDTSNNYYMFDANVIRGFGYLSAFGYDEEYPYLFIPTEDNGTSSLPIGDEIRNSPSKLGYRITVMGCKWSDGSSCGAFSLSWHDASIDRWRYVGGRLLYVPQSKIA